MGAEARRATQLLGDPNAAILNVAGCGGRFVLFTWPFHEGTTVNIWRVNADGSNPVRLTTGKSDLDPVCSPDQKWVYYVALAANQIWRVPLDGSRKPEPIAAGTHFPGLILGNAMSVSHDGKTLAYTAVAVDPKTQESISKIVMLSLESADSSRMLNANPRITGGVQFTPDGHGIAYPIRDKGIDNLWVQPLDGSAGRQITNFTSDQIAAFHWSPDGKVLALLSHNSESDVVLLRESKQ
jgi:Tol biopolymer transport system component